MVGNISRLPTELLLHIVGESYCPSGLCYVPLRGRRRRRAWFASTATVSRFWLAIVYPVLYHTVGLHTHSNTRLFLRSLIHNPSIALHVVQLSFLGHSALNAARWRLSLAPRHRLLPPALKLERTNCEPRLAKWYADIARRCPQVRKCNVDFEHMHVFDAGGHLWTDNLESLHVAEIPTRAGVHWTLPPAPRLRHLTLAWTPRVLHHFTPTHLAGYAQLEYLDLFSLSIDHVAMRAVLASLKPRLKGLKASGVAVLDAWDWRSIIAPAEWLGTSLGDSLVFRELYLCTWHMPPTNALPLCALQGVKSLTLDVQHLPLYYQRNFYPPSVESVRFVAGSSCKSTSNLRPPLVFARHAWQLITLDRDAACVPNLETVTIAVPSLYEEATRVWVFCSFMLTAAASSRGLEFKLNLYLFYVSGGDTFQWESPPRPSAKDRVRTVWNRLLHPMKI